MAVTSSTERRASEGRSAAARRCRGRRRRRSSSRDGAEPAAAVRARWTNWLSLFLTRTTSGWASRPGPGTSRTASSRSWRRTRSSFADTRHGKWTDASFADDVELRWWRRAWRRWSRGPPWHRLRSGPWQSRVSSLSIGRLERRHVGVDLGGRAEEVQHQVDLMDRLGHHRPATSAVPTAPPPRPRVAGGHAERSVGSGRAPAGRGGPRSRRWMIRRTSGR